MDVKQHTVFMSVMAHWVCDDFKINNILLALREMKGSHTGDEQAKAVLKFLLSLE
jgi:hypothetical protein